MEGGTVLKSFNFVILLNTFLNYDYNYKSISSGTGHSNSFCKINDSPYHIYHKKNEESAIVLFHLVSWTCGGACSRPTAQRRVSTCCGRDECRLVHPTSLSCLIVSRYDWELLGSHVSVSFLLFLSFSCFFFFCFTCATSLVCLVFRTHTALIKAFSFLVRSWFVFLPLLPCLRVTD